MLKGLLLTVFCGNLQFVSQAGAASPLFLTAEQKDIVAQGLPTLPGTSPTESAVRAYGTEEDAHGVAVTSSRYILGAGDRIAMSVEIVEEYSGDYQILSDGTLNLPLIGSVTVGGLTLTQATEAITNRYRQYIHYPVVGLDLVAERPIRIAVTGEINRPGTYTVKASETGIPNVTEAIQLAGGITQMADIRNVQVYRQQAGTSRSVAPVNVDLWELLTTGDISQDVALRDGDTLIIPEAISLNSSEITALAEASFSPEKITVNVVGEVEDPGAIEMRPNTPLNQALLAAGGFNNRASTGTVELIRLNSNGTVLKQEIDVDFAGDVNSNFNPPLQDSDTIVVSRSGSTQALDTVDPFLGPFSTIFRLLDLIF